MALSQVSGMANGQRYDVQVKPVHPDNLNQSVFSGISCVRTLGAAGMETEETDSVITFSEGASWSIYPNPSRSEQGQVTLHLLGWEGAEVVEVQIHNAIGQQVLHRSLNVISGQAQLEWSGCSAGVYYITLGGETVRWVVM